MNWFYNLKTSIKLISAFGMVSLILAFVGWFGLNDMSKLNNSLQDMYQRGLIPVQVLSHAQTSYQRLRINIRDIDAAETNQEKDKYMDIVKQIRKDIEGDISTFSSIAKSQQEKDFLKQFGTDWQAYNKLFDQAVQLSYAGKNGEFKALLTGDLRKQGDELNNVLAQLVDLSVKMADQQNKDANNLYASSRNITIIVVAVSIIFSIAFGYFIAQLIARPLTRVVNLVAKVARGDLRETVDIRTKDEVGLLAGSMNEMVLSLRNTVSGILASSENVSAAAQQISASTEEIASGNMSQSSSAQTMNELFKELSTAIESVAESAEQAAELSNRTADIAQSGGQAVRSSIEGMNVVSEQMSRLEDDSAKIGEIIEVIDDIADQTNLLALNAAIEAARAGDQGRGFAVVADEVRKLAERSSEATKQITAIIKGMQDNTKRSVNAVDQGVELSKKNGEAFDTIIGMVNENAQKVTEIAAASEEQAAQSSEVLFAIESISAVTEEAAAGSQETAATAQSLAQLAEQLHGSVSVFKIN